MHCTLLEEFDAFYSQGSSAKLYVYVFEFQEEKKQDCGVLLALIFDTILKAIGMLQFKVHGALLVSGVSEDLPVR